MISSKTCTIMAQGMSGFPIQEACFVLDQTRLLVYYYILVTFLNVARRKSLRLFVKIIIPLSKNTRFSMDF